jgi:uncharacterized protein YoxC
MIRKVIGITTLVAAVAIAVAIATVINETRKIEVEMKEGGDAWRQ